MSLCLLSSLNVKMSRLLNVHFAFSVLPGGARFRKTTRDGMERDRFLGKGILIAW